ncbi:hypothetical protein IWX50DRAFT_650669 [Phyllosticta citricarpa]
MFALALAQLPTAQTSAGSENAPFPVWTGLWINERKSHTHLLHHCLSAMWYTLKENICDLRDPGAAAAGINQENLEGPIPAHVDEAG